MISMNLHRRHLSVSQKATVSVDMLPLLEKEAKERQSASLKRGGQIPVREKIPEQDKGRARDVAAKATGVSARYASDLAARTCLEMASLPESSKPAGSIPNGDIAKNRSSLRKSVDRPDYAKPAALSTVVPPTFAENGKPAESSETTAPQVVSGKTEALPKFVKSQVPAEAQIVDVSLQAAETAQNVTSKSQQVGQQTEDLPKVGKAKSRDVATKTTSPRRGLNATRNAPGVVQ